MEFFINGKVYQGNVRRIKGKMKVFFKTDDFYHSTFGFDLPNYCCKKWSVDGKYLVPGKRHY
ncbi:Uncharacterised protein [Chryseobacterium taihuense]|uniref:Uncharacterized protein n=1 Tax=Chryseobacterium taihuense TaxID=1141221 RepID=A0A4U8WAV6_9FLAO|nr:Uncharacterised protein [Chryseobacterium taihuense]